MFMLVLTLKIIALVHLTSDDKCHVIKFVLSFYTQPFKKNFPLPFQISPCPEPHFSRRKAVWKPWNCAFRRERKKAHALTFSWRKGNLVWNWALRNTDPLLSSEMNYISYLRYLHNKNFTARLKTSSNQKRFQSTIFQQENQIKIE